MSVSLLWPKVFRRVLRVAGGLLGFLLIAWLLLGWYVHTHVDEIKARITTILSAEVRGEIHIGQMEPSIFRGFPDVSISLQNVSMRDSLWAQHKHSLLEVRDMDVALNPFALLSHRVELRKVSLAHGSIFLYTDGSGYSNAYLLSRKDTTKTNRPALVDRYRLQDIEFWFVNEAKQKQFHVHLADVDGIATRSGDVIHYRTDISAHVHEMAFSTIRGSYLRGQDLAMNTEVRYHIGNKRLELPEQTITAAGEPLTIGGNFYFDRVPAAFDLHISAAAMPYQKAVAMMSDNISRIMKKFDFSKPMSSLDARVSGVMEYKNIPLITVVAHIKDNALKTALGAVDGVSFTSVYNNEVIAGRGHGDDNSSILLHDVSGIWQQVSFSADTLLVNNLLRPNIKAHVTAALEVKALNDIIGDNSFNFEAGKARADLRYTGGILPEDTTPYAINGTVNVTDARLNYLPRKFVFSNVGATLLFAGDNLFFRNIVLRSKGSSLQMEGEAQHFTRLYFSDPRKMAVYWKVRGPMVNLNDFINIAGKRRMAAGATKRHNPAVARIGAGLDRLLEESSFELDAQIDKMAYQNFAADGVIARLSVGQSGIVLQQVRLGNGGGTVTVSGTVNQAAPNNPFSLKAKVQNADVARLFTAFDNFGQTAITAQNLQGRINANADVKGNVTDDGKILPASMFGKISFRLDNGRIIAFPPFEKVGRFVFKKRNLSDVAVKELHGNLEVAGTKILIRPMTIQTSVINMDVQGVYGLKGGTDIYLEVPLRNPEKEEAATPIGMLLRKGKGFVVHLRAQDPDGSGVKIGLDPLRKGKKATEQKLSGGQ